MDDEGIDRVLERVTGCLRHIVSTSGHLSSFNLQPESFRISRRTEIGGGLTSYEFVARATRESEFLPSPGTEDLVQEITGETVLDRSLNLAFDDRGRVRFGPGYCLHPRLWDQQVTSEDFEWMVGPGVSE